MAVNPTVRLIATLSNLIRRKIHSLDRIPGLTPVQDAVLQFHTGQVQGAGPVPETCGGGIQPAPLNSY